MHCQLQERVPREAALRNADAAAGDGGAEDLGGAGEVGEEGVACGGECEEEVGVGGGAGG